MLLAILKKKENLKSVVLTALAVFLLDCRRRRRLRILIRVCIFINIIKEMDPTMEIYLPIQGHNNYFKLSIFNIFARYVHSVHSYNCKFPMNAKKGGSLMTMYVWDN